MKSKKLLISLAAVALVIVFIVVMIAVFAVNEVQPQYHNFDGSIMTAPSDGSGVVPDKILELTKIKGKSIIFLSKSKLLAEINNIYGEWHAYAVTKKIPNTVVVHFMRRTVIAKMNLNGKDILIDSFGYVVEATGESEVSCIDISSAFPLGAEALSQEPRSQLIFQSEENNIRLKCVLEAILAVWRCMVEVENIPEILGNENVFHFEDSNLLITPRRGGTIEVIAPETKLSDRLIDAYSVYYNKYFDMTDGDVITVHKNGRITSK